MERLILRILRLAQKNAHLDEEEDFFFGKKLRMWRIRREWKKWCM